MIALLFTHFALMVALLVAFYGAGALVTSQRTFASRAEIAAVRVGLGMIVLSTGCVALGLLGRLTPAWWAPLLIASAAGLWLAAKTPLPPRLHGELLLLAVGGIALAPAFFLTAYPPIWFDETLYHLPTVRRFAETGALPFIAHLRAPVFPHLHEVLSVPLYQWSGASATHLLSFCATLATTFVVIAAGMRWWSRSVAAVAFAAFLSSPIVLFLGSTTYVDALLTLFVALSFYSFERWREEGVRFWLVCAAVFGGGAASVKYLGLFWLGVVGLLVIWKVVRERSSPAGVVLFASVAVGVMLPWYGRIVWYTHSPIFPFLTSIFGSSEWSGYVPPARRHLTDYLVTIIRLPWDVTVGGERIGFQPQMAPLGLAIPFVLFAAVRDRRVRAIVGIVLAWIVVWCFLPQDARFLVPALPLVAIAIGVALAPLAERIVPRVGVALLAFLMLLPGLYWARYRVMSWGLPPADANAAAAMLDRNLRGHAAVSYLNHTAEKGDVVYGLGNEYLAWYYSRGTWIGDHSGPAAYPTMTSSRTAGELRARLDRFAVKWLVTSKVITAPALESPDAAAHFERVYQDEASAIYKLRD